VKLSARWLRGVEEGSPAAPTPISTEAAYRVIAIGFRKEPKKRLKMQH